MRAILALIVLLGSLTTAFSQEQEPKLIDRLLNPNLSLVNSAQNKQFDVSGAVVGKQVFPKSFWTANKPVEKTLPEASTFSTRQLGTSHYRAEEIAVRIPEPSASIRSNPTEMATAPYATQSARENGKNVPGAPFASSRPFLVQGKSQKALNARDTPLTIEQVRELLNKNK